LLLASAMADKVLKVDSVSVLPPWDVARPLSPKRRRTTSASPSKPTGKPSWPSTSFKVACSFVVFAAGLLHLVMRADRDTLGSLNGELGLKRTTRSSINVPGSDCMLPSNVSEPDIAMQSRDAFILGDISRPSQLENYSASMKMFNRAAFMRHGPTPLSSDASKPPRVLMGKVKLEEGGTTWSQQERLTATSSMLAGVSFRLSEAANDAQERPLTYKLHWRTGPIERPRTYKLQWWSDQDVIPAPHPYELRWRK